MANIVRLSYTANEINEKLSKVDDVVQTTGNSETAVMSQKAVTDLAIERMPKLNILTCNDYIAIDTVNGTIELPATTEFMTGNFHKSLTEKITISLQPVTNTSGSYILYNKNTDTFQAYASWGIANLDLTNYYYLCAVRRSHTGYKWIASCDLSVPHYLNGFLFGCGVPVLDKLSFGVCHDFISIDNVAGTITIPAKTELYGGDFRITLSEDVIITMNDMYNTSGNVILFNKTTKAFENKTPSVYDTMNKSGYCFAFFVRRNTSGLSFKACADLSVPYYVDGVLYGAGAEQSGNVVSTSNIPTVTLMAGEGYISIDTVSGTVTIPSKTELLADGMRVILPSEAVITMSEVTNTSGNIIVYNKTTGTFENVYPWNWGNIDWTDRYYAFNVRRNGMGIKFPTCANLSIPYYVDGVLYGGAGDSGSSGESSDITIDNTKPKEFAELFYNSDKVEPFMFFTDPHLCQHEGDSWRAEFDEYMSTLGRYYKESAVTRVFCGGDWLGGTIANAKDACYRLGLADAKMRECFKEYYPMRGNHESNFDWSGSNPAFNKNAIRNLMFRKEGRTYYTVEGDNSKFYIFDTQDESSTLFDTNYMSDQLHWFAESLMNNTAENIIIMMHIVYTSFDTATSTPSSLSTTANELTHIADSFNNRYISNVLGTMYNFEKAVGKVRFLIAGHSHADYTATVNNIPTVVTTHLRDGGTPTFDMCLADYDAGKLHLVRVGTGENRTVDI